jgi:hypothetical protein
MIAPTKHATRNHIRFKSTRVFVGVQLIAEIRQPLQTLVDVEKARLTTHRFFPCPAPQRESEFRPKGEVFRTVRFGGPALQVMIDSSAVKARRSAAGGKGGRKIRRSGVPLAGEQPKSTL